MTDKSTFISRKQELNELKLLASKKVASLVVITGRRRVGKSRLITEFAKNYTYYQFSGLPPEEGRMAQTQRDEFKQQFIQQFHLAPARTDDWTPLFVTLAERVKKGRVVVVLDEISWMAQGDNAFLGKLKTAWDLYFKENPQLILILCGSVSSWIEKNVMSSTGYFGRVSLEIKLAPLSLYDSIKLLKAIGFKRSLTEKMLILSIVGGIPWYIELINPALSAMDNIQRLCFSPQGILVTEFQRIFHDLFGKRHKIYSKIIEALALKPLNLSQIASEIKYARSGALSDYVEELKISDFIQSDTGWSLAKQTVSDRQAYRLKDNYLRFYFRYMLPKLVSIKSGAYIDVYPENTGGFDALMGLQFENLIVNNQSMVAEQLSVAPQHIKYIGPYIQRKTSEREGCQIDLLIQTKYNTIFICEIKWSQTIISSAVIQEVKRKIRVLDVPKAYACIPVLVYMGELSSDIITSEYFSEIIDVGRLLID